MADKIHLFCVLDDRNEHGGDRRSEKFQSANLRDEKSSEKTAILLGISSRQVEKMRVILDYGIDEDIEDNKNNKNNKKCY